MAKFTQTELARKQVELEYHMRSVGIARFEENEMRNEQSANSSTLGNTRIISEVTEQLIERIEAFIEYYEGKRGVKPAYLNYIKLVGVKETAFIALKSTFDLMTIENMSITTLALRIGSRIEDQHRFAHLEEQAPHYVDVIVESMKRKATQSYSHKSRTLDKASNNIKVVHTAWDKEIVANLGTFIIEQVSQIEFEGEPLFTSKTVHVNPTREETVLEVSEHAAEWIERFKDKVALSRPAYSPCVVPPRDWTTPFDGGFHVPEIAETMPLIHGKRKHIENQTAETMPVVYAMINAFQKVGWRLESRVVDTLGGILKCRLPIAVPQHEPLEIRPAPIPTELEVLKGKDLVSKMTEDELEAFFQWKADAVELEAKERIRKVDLAKVSQIYREAVRFSKFDAIYFVPYMDYRQRVYITSNIITPQGNDLQKGLLRFAEKRALGFSGLYWLAIQGANTWAAKDADGIALDKKPFMQRVRHVIQPEFLEMVKSIAVDPWNDTRWCDADSPWQFLNWCFEVVDLIEHMEAGNSYKTFMSDVPVAQDGSCSGTQHYSMLLKNEESARLVNLLPCECPNDIYGSAAEGFQARLMNVLDSEKSTPLDKAMASAWLGHANRNLLKPPVMTLVYGSAARTCRKTTMDYLFELQEKENKAARSTGRKSVKKHDFESERNAASWATSMIWDAVGEVQAPAKEGMAFIKRIARFVTKHGQPLVFPAPTGFKMIQEQFSTKASRIKTAMFGGVRITLRHETKELDSAKMASSSSPNVVHTLDSSHLIFTGYDYLVIKGNVSLALIHDSFGTHAGNTRSLRRTLNRELVKMYEVDIMGEFLATNEVNCLADSEIEVPVLGGLDYKEVLKARYAFG